MKTKNSDESNPPSTKKEKVKLTYPAKDDIYNRQKKADDINPDDNSIITEGNIEDGVKNEKSYDTELMGDDLDVPGSELDDREEGNGNEDEENNYYSLPDNK